MTVQKLQNFRTSFKRFNKISAVVVAVIIVITGYLVIRSLAATNFAGFEAESSTRTAKATNVTDVSASGGAAVQFGSGTPINPPTSPGGKPTDASTGPRVSLVDAPGGNISGVHTGKRFTGMVTINGPATLTDCIIEGGLQVIDGPVVIEHCDINGWWGVTTDNQDPNKKVFTMRHSKSTGPTNGDAIRIGNYNVGWGNNSRYMNTLVEDSILHSPYSAFGANDHFDLLQFGGGRNSTFNRVIFSYRDNPFQSQLTNYVNNQTNNINVVMNDIWIEGGPIGYVLAGPMTITNCTINRSTKYYGYIYPSAGTVLVNCKDDVGNTIQGT